MEGIRHDKTSGLNYLQPYALKQNRFITYLVLVFSDLNKPQIYKMPYRESPHHEMEILMSFKYLNFFTPIEHTEDYYNRGPKDKNFSFESEDRKYVCVGKKSFSFETTDKIVEYSSNDGLNDVKYSYAHGIESVNFVLYRKCIPFEEFKNSAQKDE